MDNEKQAKVMRAWYSKDNVALLWEIFLDVNRHEVAFISTKGDINHRYYSLSNKRFFDGQMKARFIDSRYHYWNFFRSCEYLRMADSIRKKWTPFGADLIIDIDCKGKDLGKVAKKTFKEGGKIIKYLDILNVPFLTNFSGKQGLHIRIGWKALISKFSYDMDELKSLAQFICEKAKVNTKPSKKVPFADIAIIHPKNLIRVLWSLHPKSLLVCMPLDRDQFKTFTPDICSPEHIRNKIQIRNRTLACVWNPKGDVNKLWREFNAGL